MAQKGRIYYLNFFDPLKVIRISGALDLFESQLARKLGL